MDVHAGHEFAGNLITNAVKAAENALHGMKCVSEDLFSTPKSDEKHDWNLT